MERVSTALSEGELQTQHVLCIQGEGSGKEKEGQENVILGDLISYHLCKTSNKSDCFKRYSIKVFVDL
jgi:hypothetical protein